MAVAEQPAKAYNPLFLYGGAGWERLYLLNAIGNYRLSGFFSLRPRGAIHANVFRSP